MVKTKEPSNEFSKFFNEKDYLILKNELFNYKFRKYMIKKSYEKFGTKGKKFADVGCGISPVTPDIKKTILIDLDTNAINYLKSKGYNAIKGGVEKVPMPKESIDVLFSSEVLEHVENYKLAIKQFRKVIKRDGLLIITVPTHMKYWAFDDEYVAHLRRFDPQKLSKEIRESGFKILEVKPIGSLIEREITKLLVKQALDKKKASKIGNMQMTAFKLANKIFFALTYLGYILNNKKNSSIVLITARKI